jgi:RimJ/RimL family protein N-acetyltransferase
VIQGAQAVHRAGHETLAPEDLEPLQRHLVRHIAENGAGGRYFMGPHEPDAVIAVYDPAAWLEEPGTCTWQRVWAWQDERGEVRAHAALRANAVAPWRCTLAMGIEEPWRRKGHGRRLCMQAIRWARMQPELAWIDSWTFTDNVPSRAFHQALGFSVTGKTDDVARLGGRSLGQLLYVLDLIPRGRHLC